MGLMQAIVSFNVFVTNAKPVNFNSFESRTSQTALGWNIPISSAEIVVGLCWKELNKYSANPQLQNNLSIGK